MSLGRGVVSEGILSTIDIGYKWEDIVSAGVASSWFGVEFSLSLRVIMLVIIEVDFGFTPCF